MTMSLNQHILGKGILMLLRILVYNLAHVSIKNELSTFIKTSVNCTHNISLIYQSKKSIKKERRCQLLQRSHAGCLCWWSLPPSFFFFSLYKHGNPLRISTEITSFTSCFWNSSSLWKLVMRFLPSSVRPALLDL